MVMKWVIISIISIIIFIFIVLLIIGYYKDEIVNGILEDIKTNRDGTTFVFSDGRELWVRNELPSEQLKNIEMNQEYNIVIKDVKGGVINILKPYWYRIYKVNE